jgi:hypothetical protein
MASTIRLEKPRRAHGHRGYMGQENDTWARNQEEQMRGRLCWLQQLLMGYRTAAWAVHVCHCRAQEFIGLCVVGWKPDRTLNGPDFHI